MKEKADNYSYCHEMKCKNVNELNANRFIFVWRTKYDIFEFTWPTNKFSRHDVSHIKHYLLIYFCSVNVFTLATNLKNMIQEQCREYYIKNVAECVQSRGITTKWKTSNKNIDPRYILIYDYVSKALCVYFMKQSKFNRIYRSIFQFRWTRNNEQSRRRKKRRPMFLFWSHSIQSIYLSIRIKSHTWLARNAYPTQINIYCIIRYWILWKTIVVDDAEYQSILKCFHFSLFLFLLYSPFWYVHWIKMDKNILEWSNSHWLARNYFKFRSLWQKNDYYLLLHITLDSIDGAIQCEVNDIY